MPMLIGVMVVMAIMYQLFFRYDTWSSDDKPGVRYEHDNLTGETRMLKPGGKASVFARIVGNGGSDDEGSTRFLEPLDEDLSSAEAPTTDASALEPATESIASVSPRIDLNNPAQLEKVARPVPIPREVVVASSAPPVPGGNPEATREDNPYAVRQVDLDLDGVNEEIIQNAQQPDGLLDISIVKNGREIFFGRGRQIALLPTRNRGWADIALKAGAETLQVFRYDVRTSAYRAMERI